ncbi:hypothetical protein SLE2022_305700 [Rubroshorea leprosula]
MERARFRARGAATGEASGTRQRQGHRRWIPGLDHKISGQATTFFIYNFPENVEVKELWYRFQMYGKVIDVFVPKKRDKWGKRFGFLRLLGVQNVSQMVRRLNEIWIDSYKLRVKTTEDRSKERVKGSDTRGRTQHRVDRLVKPGQSYAQVVKGKEQRTQSLPASVETLGGEDRVSTHLKKGTIQTRQQNEKEEVESCQILKPKRSREKDRDAESQEESMEFTPTQEELKWLEGSMVAILKSLSLINDIQRRIDVEGGLITVSPIGGRRVLLTEKETGYLIEFMNLNKELFDLWFEDIKPWDKEVQERSRLVWLRIAGIPLKAWTDRCFKMIGESMGEVVMIHGDTKMKSILCEGRILVISSAEHKIVKQVSLKVEEQMYEIQVIEEEWRSDPDWWLSDDDRQSESATESEFSSEQNEEDQDLGNAEICSEDDVSMDEEHLMHDSLLNSNFKSPEEGKTNCHAEEGDADIEDGASGPSKTNGPLEGKEIGLRSKSGLRGDFRQEEIKRSKTRGPKEVLERGSATDRETATRDPRRTRRRKIEDCYPESCVEIRAKETHRETSKAKPRQQQRAGSQSSTVSKVNPVASDSISDGCIVNRNRLIHSEMALHEVRMMMSMGKRLGIQIQNNEEEVQSRLMELEMREAAGE